MKEKIVKLIGVIKGRYKSDILCIAIMVVFYGLFMHFVYGVRVDNLSKAWTSYQGDGLWIYLNVSNIADTGWTTTNPRVAAPFSGEFYDFPAMILTDNICNFILKILYTISANKNFAVNMGIIINGLLIAFIAYAVFRILHINSFIALPAALTYALLPYFFMRAPWHYYLAAYHFVPLAVLLCIWFYTDSNFFVINKNFLKKWKNIAALVFAVLIAENGNGYYPFFVCFFLLITGLIKSKFQIKKELFHVLLFIALIAVVFILNLLPLYFYNAEFGINNEAVIRGAGQSEVLGLKIIQLFLPIKAHGLDIINNKIMFYNASAPLINENTSAYLGLLGSIGCLFLFILLFVHTNNNKLFLMSRLNVAGVLLATIGGFSSIFSYFVSPVLRSYNRMSVFLAFFAILSIVIVINDYIDKDEKPIKTGGLFLFYITFCFFGIFWQYPYSLKNKILDNVSNLENSYNSDAEFISRIESALPKGSMIYQMPFHQFPEGWPLNNMDDYRLFAGVIHSKHLKWSFGAMRGRYPDQWHKALNAMSLDQKLNTLSFVGFEGIYIDRRAYTSSEISELEQSLSEFLGEPALYSNDNNLAFFDMANYNKQIRSSYSDNELANLKHSLLEDIYSLSNYEFRKEIFLQYGENEFKEGFLQGPGWSGPETEGTWTDGNGPAVLQFNLNDKQKMNDLQFTMQVNAMLADSYSILANGLLVSGIISEAGIIDVMIPRDILYLDDILTIAIVLNNPKIPNNSDQRLLGIRVASVSIKNYQIYSNPAVSFKMPSRKGEIAEYLFAKPYAIKSQANDYYVDRSKNIVEWNGKGIIFGPYVDAGKGRYKFVVNYTYLEYKDPCVFDILSNVTTVLTESVLESNDQQLVFEITLNNKVNLEFRVRNPGPSRIRLSSIEVIRL